MHWNSGVGEDSWESFGCQEIRSVNPKGNQSWIFIRMTDAEPETPILWPPDENWLFGKDPNSGKDWSQKEKEMTEDEMVGWTWVWVSSISWWWTGKPGVLQSMGSQRVDMTEGLNWTKLNWYGHSAKSWHPGVWSQVALRKHHYEQTSGGDGIPVELLQILKDDGVKLQHSICQQNGKLSSGYRTEKCQFSFQSQIKACQRVFKLLHNCTHLTR